MTQNMDVVYFNTDFDNMTRKEAQNYFRHYVEGHTKRVEAFRQRVAAEGGPALGELNFSAESLLPLWAWLLTRIKAEDFQDFRNSFRRSYIEGLAAYFAECVLRNMPGVSWDIARPGGKRVPSIYKNMPVLVGMRPGVKNRPELNPNETMMAIVSGARLNMPLGIRPERLRELYGIYTGEYDDWKYVFTEQGAEFVEIPKKGISDEEEADSEITFRAGKLEVDICPDDPEDPEALDFRLKGFNRYDLYLTDEARPALMDHYEWSDARLNAIDAQLYAKLVELEPQAGVIWEDTEKFFLFLPQEIKDPIGIIKKAVRAMMRRLLPEEELTWWKKKCEERREAILRLIREED